MTECNVLLEKSSVTGGAGGGHLPGGGKLWPAAIPGKRAAKLILSGSVYGCSGGSLAEKNSWDSLHTAHIAQNIY